MAAIISVSLNEAQILDAIMRMSIVDRARLISKVTSYESVEMKDENGFTESQRKKLNRAITASREEIAAGKCIIVKNKRELKRFLYSL